MPDIGVGAPRNTSRVMRAVAELADGGLGERMRLEAGVRLLVTARRVADLGQPHAGAPSKAGLVVARVLRGWDPWAVTAAEYLEALPVRELDAFLAAGPVWAAELTEGAAPALTRKAA